MRSALFVPLLSACATPQASSSIDADALRARMHDLTQELATCRQAAHEPLTGALTLSWVVEQDGRAGLVRVDSSNVASASVEGCISGVVRRSTFPPPRGEPFADASWTVDLATLDTPTTPEPAGGLLGPTDVNAVLGAHQNALASCLAMAQAGGRDVTGELELQWRVGADGRVAWARTVSTSVQDVEVERCLVSTMMTIPFPPPSGGGPADLSMPLKLL